MHKMYYTLVMGLIMYCQFFCSPALYAAFISRIEHPILSVNRNKNCSLLLNSIECAFDFQQEVGEGGRRKNLYTSFATLQHQFNKIVMKGRNMVFMLRKGRLHLSWPRRDTIFDLWPILVLSLWVFIRRREEMRRD